MGLLAVAIGGTTLTKSGLEISSESYGFHPSLCERFSPLTPEARTEIKKQELEQEKIQRLFELEKGLQSQKPAIYEICARFDDFATMWDQVLESSRSPSFRSGSLIVPGGTRCQDHLLRTYDLCECDTVQSKASFALGVHR